MEKITIKSTSAHSAVADDVVLRETKTTRLVFRPVLVDNVRDSNASIDGRFLFQRKGPNDEWEDTQGIQLSRLKKGEGVQLDLKAAEVLNLYKVLGELYDLYQQHGTRPGQTTFTKTNPLISRLVSVPTDELNTMLTANNTLGGNLLSKLLLWATEEEDPAKLVERLLELAPDSLRRLNTSANLQRLKNVVLE